MNGDITAVDYAIIGVYLLLMVGLGAVLATRIKAFKDYFLAGGALTTPLLICTLVSTYYGLDVTFGTSESGFYYGISAWLWYSCPFYVFITIAALVLARRLRQYQFMTLSDLLEHHYGPGTRVVGALACFIYNMPILQMFGLLTLFAVLGMSPTWGVIVAVVVTAAYTVMGGLWADAISDTFQFVLMCVSLAIAIPMAVHWVGGFGFTASLPEDFMVSHGGRSPWILTAWAAAGLTVLVEPSFYQRVFAAQDQRSITRALLLGIFLWAAYDWGVVMIGMVARAAVARGQLDLDPNNDGAKALLVVCMKMLPTGLRGLFLGGILASVMSTIDTYALLASGNLVYDIYRPLRRKPMSDKALILLTRVGVFAVMGVSVAVSLAFDRLRDAWLFMASVLVSVVFVPTMAALFARPRRAAGLFASVAGLLGLITFYVLLFTLGAHDPDEDAFVLRLGPVEMWQDAAALFALPVSLLGFAVGSLWPRARSD